MNELVEKCLLEGAHSPEPGLDSSTSPKAEMAAPITVYSRQETDENYKGVICRDGKLRIVNCRHDLQWIVQWFKGGQWRNSSFHRSRQSLIRGYGPLEMILALPEHHDDLWDEMRCAVCGRLQGRPKGGLVRHLFCLSDRKNKSPEALVVPGAAMAGFCGLRFVQKSGHPANQNFSTKVISTSATRGVLIS
jgi:hypothetical protein